MPPRLPSNPFTQCISCIHRYQGYRGLNRIGRAHISSKQKKQSDAIIVQLRRDIAGYGREGAYIRIPPGQMRNDFFPAKLARYVVGPELKQLLGSGRIIQRDNEFAIKTEPTEEDLEREARLAEAQKKQKKEGDMTPERAIGLIDALSKSSYIFSKTVNESRSEPSANLSSGPLIFGSVTLADIANEIKASIAHNPEAATIQFDQSNIRFLGLDEGADPTRVKTLGIYEVELTLKDVPALKRKIEIRRETKDESESKPES